VGLSGVDAEEREVDQKGGSVNNNERGWAGEGIWDGEGIRRVFVSLGGVSGSVLCKGGEKG